MQETKTKTQDTWEEIQDLIDSPEPDRELIKSMIKSLIYESGGDLNLIDE